MRNNFQDSPMGQCNSLLEILRRRQFYNFAGGGENTTSIGERVGGGCQQMAILQLGGLVKIKTSNNATVSRSSENNSTAEKKKSNATNEKGKGY